MFLICEKCFQDSSALSAASESVQTLILVFKASEQGNKCRKTGLRVCVSWVEITCVGTAESVFCQCTEIWPAPVVRHTHTHTPDENQSTARPASSDVPTPVLFINVQLKAAGPRPDAGPSRLNSTPTKQTRRQRHAARKQQKCI